jgi:hypothetical protein
VGIQTLVVFVGLAFALVVGIVAGISDTGARLAGWLAIALIPVTWILWSVTERLIGREIWDYAAPIDTLDEG